MQSRSSLHPVTHQPAAAEGASHSMPDPRQGPHCPDLAPCTHLGSIMGWALRKQLLHPRLESLQGLITKDRMGLTSKGTLRPGRRYQTPVAEAAAAAPAGSALVLAPCLCATRWSSNPRHPPAWPPLLQPPRPPSAPPARPAARAGPASSSPAPGVRGGGKGLGPVSEHQCCSCAENRLRMPRCWPNWPSIQHAQLPCCPPGWSAAQPLPSPPCAALPPPSLCRAAAAGPPPAAPWP